jgi:hypothetical protein
VCLIDFALFEKITAMELVRWPRVSKEERPTLCANVLAYIQNFNHWHGRVSRYELEDWSHLAVHVFPLHSFLSFFCSPHHT